MKSQRKTHVPIKKLTALAGLAVLLCLTSASGPSSRAAFPIIADDLDPESLRAAIAKSMQYLAQVPPERIVGEEPRRLSAAEVTATLRAFEESLALWDCRRCWIEEIHRRFEFLPSSSEAGLQSVLFTGYYQPVIEARLSPDSEYRFPLYRKPADLVTMTPASSANATGETPRIGRMDGSVVVPYYTRAEIERGALRGRGDEIAWLKDPVDVFFLQIQGSGVLRLADGSQKQVGYAAQNGWPYRSIGRLLIDQGKIPREEMSMQRLRRYLADHPEERDGILAYNESYVFFRFLDEGPVGTLGVPVTAGRSIATDMRRFPKGALAFVYSERPVLDSSGELIGWTPFLRFVLNQDTGGAIRGPQRVDLYFGTGPQAGAEAGYMNSTGKLYFVALKEPRAGARH